MDADVIAEYERLQKQATALKRMKKVVDGKIKEIQPKILDWSAKENKESISTGGGGKIVIKQRTSYATSISLAQIPEALKGSVPEGDVQGIVELCKTFVGEKKKPPCRYAEYHLPHPNMPGKTIQQKDVALPPETEQKILNGLDGVMKLQLHVAANDGPKRKRAKSEGPKAPRKKRASSKKKQGKQEKQPEEDANDELDTS